MQTAAALSFVPIGKQVRITDPKSKRFQDIGMVERIDTFGEWVRHSGNELEHHPFGTFQEVN